MQDKQFIGIDVSRDWIDIAVAGTKDVRRIANTAGAASCAAPRRARNATTSLGTARGAIRWNPIMRAFFQRLTDINKRAGKVALVAVMRKMLVTLNAMARDQQDWSGMSVASERIDQQLSESFTADDGPVELWETPLRYPQIHQAT